MKILAIETSCDDTGIAILEEKKDQFKVLANIVSSQAIHQNYGGVFPMMAKREHQRNLVPVLEQALKLAKLRNSKFEIRNLKTVEKILEKEQDLLPKLIEFLQTHEKPTSDYIAVTHGPGLEPCLWVGINFARVLSLVWDIPLIPVNHIEAHILVNFLEAKSYKLKAEEIFPSISLVVSGGHTQLILVKGIGKYEIIGETRDDAAGECFDKCAKLLGLGYPGGPIISKIAEDYKLKAESYRLVLPRPMINSKNYDFSFSGLKTAVLYKVKEQYGETPLRQGSAGSQHFVSAMCVEIQQSIIDVLLKKTLNASKAYKAKTIILGGGVSANKELRKQFKEKSEIPVIFPEPKLSTDNALMIAVAAALGKKKKATWKTLAAHANLRVGL